MNVSRPLTIPPGRRLPMQQMVASFASQGVPSAAGLPTWPLFNNGSTVMRLQPGQSATDDAAAHHDCNVWRGLFPKELS